MAAHPDGPPHPEWDPWQDGGQPSAPRVRSTPRPRDEYYRGTFSRDTDRSESEVPSDGWENFRRGARTYDQHLREHDRGGPL